MALKDFFQEKRKLKHPQVRRWSSGKGDASFSYWSGTKERIQAATKQKGDWTVAYRGKEYAPKEFLKKHPKYRMKIKKKRRY